MNDYKRNDRGNSGKNRFVAGEGRSGSFNRDSNRPRFGGASRNWRGEAGKDFGRPEMFQATCASCGKPCEVPFKPNGKKPVYCRDCFAQNGGPEVSPRPTNRFSERKNFSDRPSYKPDFKQEYKEEYRPNREGNKSAGNNDINELKKQIEAVNSKLDKLIQIIEGVVSKSAPVVSAPEVLESAPQKKSTSKKIAKKK